MRRGRIVFFKPAAAICFRIDRDLPKDVPLEVRRAFYSALETDPHCKRLEQRSGALSYVLDAAEAGTAVAEELGVYRAAMQLVRTDPEVQGGAATFVGTRILVHTIAELLQAGASTEELSEDFPNLTAAMLEAAPLYARSHPRRGRPRAPRWRGAASSPATAG